MKSLPLQCIPNKRRDKKRCLHSPLAAVVRKRKQSRGIRIAAAGYMLCSTTRERGTEGGKGCNS